MAEKRFSVAQVWLHWVIAALIILEFVTGDAMTAFEDQLRSASVGWADKSISVSLHMVTGSFILALAGFRVMLFLRDGVPPHPKESPKWLVKLADNGHKMIYFLIFLTPIFGMIAIVFQTEAWILAHQIARIVLLIAVIGHIFGVIYEGILSKWEPLKAMLRFTK